MTNETKRWTRKIQLFDSTDWGCQGSDAEHVEYEALVAEAIAEAFPGVEVDVQSEQRVSPYVIVTTRDAGGRIKLDRATCLEESEIEESVKLIAARVWEAGAFWASEASEASA